MLRAVIFDMDGLMIDTEVISYKCYKDLLNRNGYEMTMEDYVKDYPGRQLITSLNLIKQKYNLDYNIEDEFENFHQLENQIIKKDGAPLKKGLIDLLTFLKTNGYKTIVATSSLKDRAEQLLNEHQITAQFEGMVCGKDVKRGKPFPDIFLKACEKLNINPNEAIVLEDSEAGIQAAYDAHIPVICIPDLKYPDPEFAMKTTAILKSLDEVINYIHQL